MAVVFGAGHTVPVAEAVELFWVEEKHSEAPLEHRLDDRSVRHLDANSDRAGVPTALDEPGRERGESLHTMRELPLLGPLLTADQT